MLLPTALLRKHLQYKLVNLRYFLNQYNLPMLNHYRQNVRKWAVLITKEGDTLLNKIKELIEI